MEDIAEIYKAFLSTVYVCDKYLDCSLHRGVDKNSSSHFHNCLGLLSVLYDVFQVWSHMGRTS